MIFLRDFKIIHDSVHGSIKLEEPLISLLETPELQRMNSIRQLGLTYLIFPGANHTRLEHSLGTSYLAELVSRSLNLNTYETLLLRSAGLLHDIGHSPYSHTLERFLFEKTGKNHMQITKDIIEGSLKIMNERSGLTIREILEQYSIDVEKLCSIITGNLESRDSLDLHINDFGQGFFSEPDRYLTEIINGSLDVDQLDYLVRDSHYTGVAYGVIDIPRIINTIRIYNGSISIDKKGLSAIEGILVARALMYSSVYFHKTARIAELMLTRGVEELKFRNWNDLYRLGDSELISLLINSEGYSKDIGFRLKYRRLYKRAYVKYFEDLDENETEKIIEYSDAKKIRKLEREISEELSLEDGMVLIDIPEKDIILNEPRFNRVNIKIYDENNVQNLYSLSPLAKSLTNRRAFDWVFMAVTPEEYTEKVNKKVKNIF
jgi:HD superfamily phosphohydrolase